MKQKKYNRLQALALQVQKIDARIVLYQSADEPNAPDVQLMVRQYIALRRERYADYLQELITLEPLSKDLYQSVMILLGRIFTDDTTSENNNVIIKQTLDAVLKVS